MTLGEEILELKKKRSAVILAHNYVRGEIQDLADFCGDSLELSIRAKALAAPVILFCGVRFMAETAKLLSPDSEVLLPNSTSGCPMADMASAEAVTAYKREHPDTVLVAYVNSTAAVKALVDICCTSGNAEKVLKSIPPDKEVLFLPDRNLGANTARKMHRNLELWHGFCPAHHSVNIEAVEKARAAHPGAEVFVHPECQPDVVKAVDAALSTGGILNRVRESDKKEFVIGTETGILHRLRKENPEKIFHPLMPEIVCPNMKKITLEDLRDSLLNMEERIVLPADLMENARRPIEAMLALE